MSRIKLIIGLLAVVTILYSVSSSKPAAIPVQAQTLTQEQVKTLLSIDQIEYNRLLELYNRGAGKHPDQIAKEKRDAVYESKKQDLAVQVDAFINSRCSSDLSGMGRDMVDLGEQYNRHPFAVLAIITADSSCGRNLTTRFNFGNVGNTDSCATCQSYSSAREGIEAVYKVLNNNYLGWADKLCQLSNGGRFHCPEALGKPIYASSWNNWQNNTNAIYSELLGIENAGNTQSILFNKHIIY